jgi:4-diphosphocytidyl-2-C-methyl-D-erythritol kinase
MRLTLRASAKINLDLQVGARRPDGYHDLQTLLQTLDLHDTVTIESRRGPFALDGDAALMPLDETNLVWRAAAALWRAAGKSGDPRGVHVRVSKRIPPRAGLGGGSSDAAAALAGLSRVWRLSATLADLMPLAATLGSDVPFFLVGGTALGLGRGERLYPLANRPRRHVVIAVPDFGVSTPDAYRWLAEDRASSVGPGSPDPAPCPSMNSGHPEPAEGWPLHPGGWRNDLEGPVERRQPAVGVIRQRLAAAGAELARMSGSGSAVFGLFATESAARRAAAGLAREGHRVVRTRTRPRNLVESRRLA